MLEPLFLIPLQLFIFIANTISIAILEAILYRDDIVRTWHISCTMFIAYYYAGWGILLLIIAYTANNTYQTPHYYRVRLTLHIFNTIYDIGILSYTILGFTTVIPDMLRYTAKQQNTVFVSANIIYQIITLAHTVFNVRYIYDYFSVPTTQTSYTRRIIYRVHPVITHPLHQNILHVLHVPEKSEAPNNTEKTFCCICMTEHTHVTILPCKHREFCLKCIERIRELQCPLCRVPFTTVESERLEHGECAV